jgi:hypothetical protein
MVLNRVFDSGMAFEEKYEKPHDQPVLIGVVAMVFLKEMGLADKYVEYSLQISKKKFPALMGSAFKLVRRLAPSRAFKQLIEYLLQNLLVFEPSSNVEIVSLSVDFHSF